MSAAVAALEVAVQAANTFAAECEKTLKHHEVLQIEVTRDLTLDLARELDAITGRGREDAIPPELLSEGARGCADLANLAACALPELPPESFPSASGAVHLAAGAVRTLRIVIENGAASNSYALRDARSAVWRADLAARQVAELSEAR